MATISEEVSESGGNIELGLPMGERVVISGMSGLYPNARNVKELADILYKKINPVTLSDSRWVFNHSEMTGYTGKVSDLTYFDAQFFKVHYLLGATMDVMSRKILEQAYMAIYDAGVNPDQLNGKKVGVYIGTGISENEKVALDVMRVAAKSGFVIMGCNKSMFANRISYWLNAKGPSIAVDQACCSTIVALELAYQALVRGECESAIVGGCNLCLHPHSLIHYGRLLKLSKDGKTKSFDEKADGSVKSEAINVLFLQKAKDALRIYAEVVNAKSEFSLVAEGDTHNPYGLYRNPADVTRFLKRFYEESNVPPEAIEYVEGCGSAIPKADKAELEAYENVFCGDRKTPLLVGSVMSNIGNVEAASGIAAITKILLGYYTGVLAGNLHCETPRRDVDALLDGRMAIVNDHVPFGRGYTAVNRYSVTGANAHLILKGHYKPKDPSRYKSKIPHLVLVSARQDTAVVNILNDLKSRPVDPEEIALLNNAHDTKISGHLGRGFTILDTNEHNKTISLSEKADYFDYVKRPLWFVYSGMGSQYNGMGTDLMRIPVFSAAIERCHRVLQTKGIDIIHIITSPDKSIFDNILHSFVGIAAIQIGLTNILSELGIVPDKIIGHSVGELGCAYADGCLTVEEMILSAYSRGLVSVQTSLIRGSMAAVGIGYQQIVSMCPPEIEVACHNSPESCTISGPVDIMREFVASLVEKDIFAKEVPCSNIAYHSRYIANAGPGLLKYLSEVIKTPKLRSERWVSTSVPMDKWNEPTAKYSSAEYHTNNLLNTVLFEETCILIPPNAILVEIAPHGLLQSILKRSLPESCVNIPLTRRGCHDNAVFLLEAIGNLYIQGLNPKIQSLYPKIEFPVSTGTPMLSHLVEWSHHEKWTIPLYLSASKKIASATNNIISLHDGEYAYLQGHVIGGKILYPFAAVLVAVWDTLAMTLNVAKRSVAVDFHDVMLHVQPIMHDRRQLRLGITLQRGTGRFEVMDDLSSKVASGFIHEGKESSEIHDVIGSQSQNVNSNEIYNYFLLRGYDYKDVFRSIHSANSSLTEARIQWSGNWVTFIDGVLQFINLRHSYESFSHPCFIGKLSINPNEQDNYSDTLKTATVLEVSNLIKCGGIRMGNVKFNDLPMAKSTTLRGLKFIPHFASDEFDFETILQVYLQIIAENVGTRVIHILGIYNVPKILSLFNKVKSIMDVSDIATIFTWLSTDSIKKGQICSSVNVILIYNLATDDYMCQILHNIVEQNTFVINIRESVNNLTNINRPSALYQVVCDHNIQSSYAVELVRWRPTNVPTFTSVISVNSQSDFPLIFHERDSLLPCQNLFIITTNPAVPGLKDLLNQFKKKSGDNIRLVMCDNVCEGSDDDALINTSLSVTVMKNGVSGGEYYVPLVDENNVEGNMMLQSSPVGQIESLKWVQASLKPNTGVTVEVMIRRKDYMCQVHYAAINDLDAKRLNGLIPLNRSKGYGMDFSGITESGTRVMGLVDCGAVSRLVRVHPNFLWPVPSHWSLEDAATVPLAYCLAYYCLSIKYKLFTGMRVLVHGGAGALGQAVISLALANHCEVFATVGDARKKQFLLKLYPSLRAENIGNSRDLTFFDLVLNATNGEGVDIVISTLYGEPKTVSLKCVAHMGVGIDVNQISGREHFEYGMYHMTKARSYITVDIFSIFNDNGNTMKKLQRMISDGIVKGWVRPLSRVIYVPKDVTRAFRLLAGCNQRGRVLLHLQQADAKSLRVEPQLQCSWDTLHIIISDHLYFGQQMADMLISRGVRKLCLNILASPEDFHLKKRHWQRDGIEVCCKYMDELAAGPELLTNDSVNSVEGIYILLTNKLRSVLETNTFVETIDDMTRKMFPDLKYFAVVNTVNSSGEEICISRNIERFATTMLRLPELKEIDGIDIKEGISVPLAVATAERAILSGEPVLCAHIKCTPTPLLLEQITAVAGLNIIQDAKNTTTLSDLGVDSTKANIVSVYLRNTQNIFFTVDEIQALTLERIKDIDEILTKTEFESEKGLNKLFTYVDTDEIVATTEMVFMPTLTRSATWRDNEFDVTSPYLCIVPGVEGHYGRFRMLCEGLKLAALVLQPDIARPYETIPETARRYAEILSQTADPKKQFYLLGYESGVLVALEMAAILEQNGFSVLIFCIGTPDQIKTEIKEHLEGLETTEALQDAIVRLMFSMMTKRTTDELELVLQGVTSWDEKLKVTVRTLLGKVSHSSQYAHQLIEAAFGRVLSLLQYEVKVKPLRSQLIILQPKSTAAIQKTALQRYSQQSVVCYQLRAPLSQATDDVRCAAIINAHLEADILEEFENKNQCESYVLDTEAIMKWCSD